MSKRAFLIGINHFNRPDWELRGCVNDAQAMRQLLVDLYDFANDQIRVLHDGDATAQQIRDGLAWLFSDYSGGGQDVRLFHIASHGTQVADAVDDEGDKLDEVIVPHDHSWQSPFKDDHLRTIFEKVPDDVAFTFVADCCHSGSIQKAVYPPEARDVRERYVEPPAEMQKTIDQIQRKQRDAEEAWLQPQLEQARGDRAFREWLDVRDEIRNKLLARFRREKKQTVTLQKPQVLLAACRDEQTAADAFIEDQYRGAFTWSLVTAIREANGAITYGDLIERSAHLLKNYTQDPQLDAPETLRNRPFLNALT